MRLTLFFTLIFFCLAQGQAAEVSIHGSSSLHAQPGSLQGETFLSLEGSQSVYDMEVFAIYGGREIPLHQQAAFDSGQILALELDLPYEHDYEGRYYLLLSIRFRGVNEEAHSLAMAIPYAYGELGGRPTLPLLEIDGSSLEWNSSTARGEMRWLELTTGPHWKLAKPVAYNDDRLHIVPRSDTGLVSDTIYPQIAILNWLGEDGFHYSRLIPWEAGPTTGKYNVSPLGKVKRPVLVFLWLSLLVLAVLGALCLKSRPGHLQSLFDYSIIAALTLWLASYLHPELWLLKTWPTSAVYVSSPRQLRKLGI